MLLLLCVTDVENTRHNKMVLDIAMFREKKGGDPNRIRESERRRFADPANVDLVIALDEQWREGLFSFFLFFFSDNEEKPVETSMP